MNDMRFQVVINATKEKVWNILWDDSSFREWAGIIDPGTYMKGELKEGGEVQFISAENGYGVTSLVAKVIPNELLLFKHRSDTKESGAQKRDDEWTGGEELYELSSRDNMTILKVSFGVPTEMEEYFKENYPKALDKIKTLAES